MKLYLGNTLYQYLYFLGAVCLGIIAGKLFTWLNKSFLKKMSAKTKTKLDDLLLGLMEKPLVFLFFLGGVAAGKEFLTMTPLVERLTSKALSALFTLNIAWFVSNFIDALITNYVQPLAERTRSELDDHLLPLMRKLVKFVVISIAIVMIIDNFGYNVSSLLAGLGLGGLAFALAAKDLLGNFFGGLAIAVDRPFKIGDRIKLSGEVDGWVRDIGLRTTRIETLDGTMLIIPNSKLTDSIVENVSKEPARKVKLVLGLEYDTPVRKLERAKKILREIIKETEGVRDDCVVAFTEFADSSINILLIYWITKLDSVLAIKDEVNTEVKKRFEKAGLSFAFPTRTIYTRKG